MAKTKISEYSVTNSSNTDINSINIDEGCAPSGINNAIREVMVHLKNWQTNASGDGATFASLVVQGTGSFTGAVTMSAGATLSGTNTLSGSNIISGNINSSGTTNTFSGTTVMSGANSIALAAGSASAPSLLANGDTNTGIWFPAADTLAISTGGSERVRVDSSGNVGIGTSSPTSKLRVEGVIQVSGSGNPSSGAGWEIGYGAVTAGRTSLQSYNRTGSAWLGADYNSLDHYFYTSGTERARITSAGELLVGKTSATANGGVLQVSNGITFPATQSACSDANTLDDYEEGTWTPTIGVGGSTASGTVYTVQEGKYTKIGRIVIMTFVVVVSAKGTATGNARIIGFPFSGTTFSGYVNADNLNTNIVSISPRGIYSESAGSTMPLDVRTAASASASELTFANFFTDTSVVYGTIIIDV